MCALYRSGPAAPADARDGVIAWGDSRVKCRTGRDVMQQVLVLGLKTVYVMTGSGKKLAKLCGSYCSSSSLGSVQIEWYSMLLSYITKGFISDTPCPKSSFSLEKHASNVKHVIYLIDSKFSMSAISISNSFESLRH